MRRCTDPACKTMHFPRTDPAVIMLVTDGERALLGRNKNFPPGMYSTLAGLCRAGRKPGRRGGARGARGDRDRGRRGPLPLLAALAVPGQHHARLPRRGDTSEITVDYGELADASWFERDWLLSHVDDDSFRLPRLDSIARRLIEDWLYDRVAGAAS